MNSIPPSLHIAKPCPKLWSELQGDDKCRFCSQCQLHVHDLSAMNDRERTKFLVANPSNVCVTYQLAPDGSMVTPTPTRTPRIIRLWQVFRSAAAAMFATGLPFLFSSCECKSERVMGTPQPLPSEHRRLMGDVCPSPPPQPPSIMGKLAPAPPPLPTAKDAP